MRAAYVSGIAVTPFGAHGSTPLVDLGLSAATDALADAGISYDAVGEVFASSMLAPPQSALKVAHGLGRTAIPVTALESASAGGMVAFRHAVNAVRSGRCEVALAVGYEKSTALEPGGVVPAATGFWDRFPPQTHYAIEASRWLHDTRCGPEVIAAVAAKAWNQARMNPLAARQADHEVTAAEVLESRLVASPLTRMMCHAVADGAAAVVVTATSGARGLSVLAVEQTSQPADPTWPTIGPVVGPPSQTTLTAERCYAAAGKSPKDVGVVNLHDMCTSEEITTLVALGLATDDEVAALAIEGGLASDGRLPTNTDGGCIARGHPMGATGLAQVAEVATQLRGNAGERQVRDPQTGLVQAAGGGGSCVVALLESA